MIPQNAELLREQYEQLQMLYPNDTEKQLFWRAVDMYYEKIPNQTLKKLLANERIPSMDTFCRRGRELREGLRDSQKNLLINL